MNALDRVRQSGVLRVATINSPTTYYMGPLGPTGFEYDLAEGLAKRLGVILQVEIAESASAAMALVKSGRVDLAAASLGVSTLREQHLRFSRPVLSVVPQLVYRAGETRPRSVDKLEGRLVVSADSVHAQRLAHLKQQNPALAWEESADDDSEDLLEKVASGEIDYTIANSDVIAINQRYYPRLRVGFDIAESQDLAWAFAPDRDTSFFDATAEYLNSIRDTELARLRDRHFGHIAQVDSYGAVALATHVKTRLPRYREAFQKQARRLGLDWRLLAAVAYQESMWDPDAISATGVRGLMQLTTDTATRLNIADREDPIQSISGGASYLRAIIDLLPKDIAEPDRTWLALAAYNMGVGHLNDVRELTEGLGGDSKRWLDVRNSLPLLGQPKWYQQTRHGYARGRQAMHFVGNVRSYFDMLVWLTEGDPSLQTPEPQTVLSTQELKLADRPVRDAEKVLRIRTPIL